MTKRKNSSGPPFTRHTEDDSVPGRFAGGQTIEQFNFVDFIAKELETLSKLIVGIPSARAKLSAIRAVVTFQSEASRGEVHTLRGERVPPRRTRAMVRETPSFGTGREDRDDPSDDEEEET